MSVVSLPPSFYHAVFKCKLCIIIGNITHLRDVISYPMASISCRRVHIKIVREPKCANKLQICPSLTLISILALFDITLRRHKGAF